MFFGMFSYSYYLFFRLFVVGNMIGILNIVFLKIHWYRSGQSWGADRVSGKEKSERNHFFIVLFYFII